MCGNRTISYAAIAMHLLPKSRLGHLRIGIILFQHSLFLWVIIALHCHCHARLFTVPTGISDEIFPIGRESNRNSTDKELRITPSAFPIPFYNIRRSHFKICAIRIGENCELKWKKSHLARTICAHIGEIFAGQTEIMRDVHTRYLQIKSIIISDLHRKDSRFAKMNITN